MTRLELFTRFIALYVIKERRVRWQLLAKKDAGISDNYNQLERHLNGQCSYKPQDDADVIQFVDTFKPVWICGVAGDDSPLQLSSIQAARAAMAQGGFRLGFIVMSAETDKALYVNNDDCSWLCGLSLAELSLYAVGE